MPEKETTIDDLAVMVKKGFDGVDKKLDEFKSDVDERLDHIDARLGRLETDVNELRGEIVYRQEFEDALGRIKYIEGKLGIESGK
ncbi:MAG: hypothetical protein ACE5JQ_00845 [Candidatus Methylomirabilales bacterium]